MSIECEVTKLNQPAYLALIYNVLTGWSYCPFGYIFLPLPEQFSPKWVRWDMADEGTEDLKPREYGSTLK
jgi:hypothetical protein